MSSTAGTGRRDQRLASSLISDATTIGQPLGTVRVARQGVRQWLPSAGLAWLWIPLTVGLLARIVLALLLPLTFDEAWTIKEASSVSIDMLMGRHGDAHPPLSYLVYA